MPDIQDQCPWTIRWGTSAETTTRCGKTDHLAGRRAYRQPFDPASGEVTRGYITPEDLAAPFMRPAPPDPEHEGPGLIAGQRIFWQSGDRREYTGEWPGYCDKIPLPAFAGGCVLPLNHGGGCAP